VADRYYVGGNGGSWDVTSSWSAISGGSGGASVPTSSDNIYIDANSGLQSNNSKINYTSSNTLNCLNVTMSQAGTVSFGSGSMDLDVYGSAVLVNLIPAPLTVNFYGTGAQTLSATNCNLAWVMYVYGASISLTLQSSINVDALEVYAGALDLNGYNVTCQAFVTTGSGVGTVYLRSGTVTFSSAFELQAGNITLIPGTATVTGAGEVGFVSPSQTVTNLVLTGTTTFTAGGTITNLTWARGIGYTFQPGITITVTNQIQQTGTGTTQLSSSSTTNFTLSSPTRQILSNMHLLYCTAAGAGVPFLATNASIVPNSNVNWIVQRALFPAGD